MHYYERKVQELCARAIAARTEDEIDSIISELRSVLREHSLAMQNNVYRYRTLHPDPELVTS
jgi:hypothetical protein